MDMGFHLVYNLSRTLFRDSFLCIGKGDGYGTSCPSNDHSNDYYHKTPEAKRYAPDRLHSDGGYALRHRWM